MSAPSTPSRPSEAVLTDPADTVRAFFAALTDRAFPQALALTEPGIVWRNSGLPTLKGKMVGRALKATDLSWIRLRADFHHIVVDGDVVLTHRTDFLRLGPLEIDFWLYGTFRFENDRIIEWHDYFSWTNVAGGVVRGLLRMARGR